MKPKIKWWGNGDVHIGCHNAFIKCYPSIDYSKIVFRGECIPRLPFYLERFEGVLLAKFTELRSKPKGNHNE